MRHGGYKNKPMIMWTEEQREKRREYERKRWTQMSPEQKRARASNDRTRANARRRYWENVESSRTRYYRYHIKFKYGLTVERYEEILKNQNGLCAICKELPSYPKRSKLHVDHDHVTGKVRGLLCAACNKGVSHIEDLDWVYKAYEYLKTHSWI